MKRPLSYAHTLDGGVMHHRAEAKRLARVHRAEGVALGILVTLWIRIVLEALWN